MGQQSLSFQHQNPPLNSYPSVTINMKTGPLPKVTNGKQIQEIGRHIAEEVVKMHRTPEYRPHRNLLHNMHRISWTVTKRDATKLLSIFGRVGAPLGSLRVSSTGDLYATQA